jgi:transcriptional regulator with XRE-family HTH domain
MAISPLAGVRLRERRVALGMRQAAVAEAAGISASYLNLIEHSRRRVGPELLERLAAVLGQPAAVLAEGPERGRLLALRAAAAASGPQARPEVRRLDDFVARFPGWADLIVAQAVRAGDLERLVGVLNDRLGQDPHLSAALHEVLSAVSSVRSTAAILAETPDIAEDWRQRFLANLHADSERLAQGAEALVAYLDAPGAADARIATAPLEEALTALAEAGWQAPDPARLATGAGRVLAAALAAELAVERAAMPEAAVLAAAGDPLRLASACGVAPVAALRRLALAAGDGLVVCDGAGALVFWAESPGFPLPRQGAACPLWPLFTALARPGEPVEVLAEVPGPVPRRFRLRALGEVVPPAGWGEPPLRRAAMQVVPDPAVPGPGLVPMVVGGSCRICPREPCPARREPSILGA